MATEGQPDEIEPDPRESAFVLPPLDGRPFADARDKALAVLRVIEQAERERTEHGVVPPPPRDPKNDVTRLWRPDGAGPGAAQAPCD